MRTSRPRARVGSADLDQDDGFAVVSREFGNLDELCAVGGMQPFDKPGNDACVWIVQQVPHVVGKLQVGLIAGGDDVAVADTRIGSPCLEWTKRGCSALTYQPNGPGGGHDARGQA